MKYENLIQKYRFEHDEMTQQELAEKVGVTKRTILSIESGKSVPSTTLAIKIAKVFGQNVEEVFILKDEVGD